MHRIQLISAALIISLCVLAACNSQPELQPSAQGQARAAAKATQSNLKLAIATDPKEPAEEKPFVVRVHVTDQLGASVKDAQLRGSLISTTMDHGKNEFAFSSKGNGDYEASSSAAMEGPWEVKVVAKRGADLAEQTFPVTVVAK